ncbi:MAG: phenylacetate--CoA ligase family protein, partial [Candidatus Methanomethylophilaceae archaeon]|nr:phenylacetate--CoA ligase family protein [Candidatus Methanomethylophilaceae archaeon]
IDIITGRTDDMIKVKGVNMFPAQFEELLAKFPEASSEYQVMIDHLDGKDILTLFFETVVPEEQRAVLEKSISAEFKSMINITINSKAVNIGDLPRSEKKTPRIFDNRY